MTRQLLCSLAVAAVAMMALVLTSTSADAALIASENFESYTAGNDIGGGSGGTGWTAAWDVVGDAGDATVQSGVIAGFGKSLRITDAGGTDPIARRAFAPQAGTVFLGLLLQSTALDDGEFFQTYLTDAAGSNANGASMGIRNNPGNPLFARVATTTTNSTIQGDDGSTFQLVLKITKTGVGHATNYTQADLFVDQATEGTPDATRAGTNSTVDDLVRFGLRTHNFDLNIDYAYVDEIRIATTYAEALADGDRVTIGFREGVSPSAGYVANNTWLRSGGSANTPQDDDPDDEVIVGFSGTEMRPMFEFDLTQIETIAAGNPVTIDSVQLVLTSRGDSSGTDLDLNLRDYGFAFVESAATWNDPDGDGSSGTGDTTAGGTLGTVLQTLAALNPSALSNGDTVTFDDSAAFQTAVEDALSAGDNTLRLLLEPEDTSGTFIRFYDETVATAGYRPELVVEFTVIPEPSTLALAALGMLGLLACGRRRKFGI